MGAHPTPTAAYWAFFENFNAKDPVGWAGAMSYPHVRVSATQQPRRGDGPSPRTASGVYPTADDYAAMATGRPAGNASRPPAGCGPRASHRDVVASSEPTRCTWPAAGPGTAPTTPRSSPTACSTFSANMDGGWGIQARFGIDGYTKGRATARDRQNPKPPWRRWDG